MPNYKFVAFTSSSISYWTNKQTNNNFFIVKIWMDAQYVCGHFFQIFISSFLWRSISYVISVAYPGEDLGVQTPHHLLPRYATVMYIVVYNHRYIILGLRIVY